MNQPGSLSLQRVAAVIHAALVVSSLFFIGVVLLIRGRITPLFEPPPGAMLPVAGAIAAAGFIALAAAIRRHVPTPERGSDLERWWSGNRGRLVTVWALGEGSVLLGGVAWFLTGSGLVLALLCGAGLYLLAWYRPSKLLESW